MMNSIKLITIMTLAFAVSASSADEYLTADCGLANGGNRNVRSNKPAGLYQPLSHSASYQAAQPLNYFQARNQTAPQLKVNSSQNTGSQSIFAPRVSAYGQRTTATCLPGHNTVYGQTSHRQKSHMENLWGALTGQNLHNRNHQGIVGNNGYSRSGYPNPSGYYGR